MRAVRTSATTLRHTFEVDEEAAESSTPVTVDVVDANGTTLVLDGAATLADDGSYTYTLAGQAALADLTVTWSGTIGGTAVVEDETVPVVGRRLFSLREGRNSDESLADEAKYTTAQLREARDETEDELDEIMLRSWVPRYRRAVLDGTGTGDLLLPDVEVSAVRAVTMADRLDGTYTPFTSGQLAALATLADGTLRRVDGNAWSWGNRNVTVEYEYGGTTALPADLRRAVLTRFRTRLNMPRSGIPDRATSFTSGEGGTYRLSLPTAYQTGIPDVDAVYDRYSRRSAGSGKRRPASRTLSYDVQRGSLFHRRY